MDLERLPVTKLRFPVGLLKQRNGELNQEVLVPIRPSGRLYHSAAAAWEGMRLAARAEGIRLAPTSVADAYRSLTVQTAVFQIRYTKKVLEGRPTRIWNNERYYLRRGFAPVAVPGTSNHGWGLAVDVASVGEGGRLEWLAKNAPRFGWSWEVVPQEPWHIRYVLGDDLPEAVT